jgi:hypothetical protein
MTTDPDHPGRGVALANHAEPDLIETSSGAIAGVRWAAATRPGGDRPNQDRYLLTPTRAGLLAAVIDGATTVSRAHPDGADYAHALAAALVRGANLAVDSLVDLLRYAITRTRDKLELPGPTAPSAAVALAHVRPSRLDVAVLGDCTAAIALASQPDMEIIRDDRLQGIAVDIRHQYRQRLAAGGGFSADHAERLTRLRDAELSARNAPDGYPIAADDPQAADAALTRSWPLSTVQWVVLASDGAAAAIRYDTPPGGWAGLAHTDPGYVLRATQAVETTDSDARRWPRSKAHDDKTLVTLTRAPRTISAPTARTTATPTASSPTASSPPGEPCRVCSPTSTAESGS